MLWSDREKLAKGKKNANTDKTNAKASHNVCTLCIIDNKFFVNFYVAYNETYPQILHKTLITNKKRIDNRT